MTSVWQLLDGVECPECGRPIDGGSLRYEGWAWAHRSEHANAGHHAFDVLEALGVEPHPPGFVPMEVVGDGATGEVTLRGEVTIPVSGPEEVTESDG